VHERIPWTGPDISAPVAISASARRSDGTALLVYVSNVAPAGCRLLADRSLSVGEELELTIPGLGAMRALVRWTAGEKAGLAFVA
jgi:hypothetical protein